MTTVETGKDCASSSESTQFALECRDLGKVFPGVIALDGVDLNVRRGEVHEPHGEHGVTEDNP